MLGSASILSPSSAEPLRTLKVRARVACSGFFNMFANARQIACGTDSASVITLVIESVLILSEAVPHRDLAGMLKRESRKELLQRGGHARQLAGRLLGVGGSL